MSRSVVAAGRRRRAARSIVPAVGLLVAVVLIARRAEVRSRGQGRLRARSKPRSRPRVMVRDWLKFAPAFEVEDLLTDPRYAQGPLGVSDEEQLRLRQRLEETVRTKPLAYWEQRLIEYDCAFGVLQSREQYIEEEQVRLMEMVLEVEEPELGPTKQMGIPIDAYGTPSAVQRAAPRLDPSAPAPGWKPRKIATVKGATGSSALTLDGIVILDVATWVAGSFGPTLLSDLGADVIKIEPLDGDPSRQAALAYIGWNRGKRSLALDLRNEHGQKAFERVVAGAHAVLTNLRPEPAKRLGISWEAIHRINPNAIFVSTTTNGLIGALKDRSGYDQVFEARSGMSYQQAGGEGGEPVILGAPIDHTTGATNGLACLAGLYQQVRTGEAQELHTSLLQGGMTVAANEFVFYPGRPSSYTTKPEPQGTSALRQAYECGDGKWIFLSLMAAPSGWEALASALGKPNWLKRWPGDQAQAEPADGALADQVATVLQAESRDVWVERLQNASVPCVPCVPCLAEQEVFDHPHPAANDLVFSSTYSGWTPQDLGALRQVGRYVHFSDAVPPGRPTAKLGEHSAEVLRQFGFSEAEIEDLIREHAILALDAAAV